MAIDSKMKALVFYLSRIEGLSIRKVAKTCNVSRATVWRISKLDMNTTKCEKTRQETRRRPRKLDDRHERKLWRSIQTLREREGNFTITRLMENSFISRNDVSESTISRFLNREGYYYIQAHKKGLLTKTDVKKHRILHAE